ICELAAHGLLLNRLVSRLIMRPVGAVGKRNSRQVRERVPLSAVSMRDRCRPPLSSITTPECAREHAFRRCHEHAVHLTAKRPCRTPRSAITFSANSSTCLVDPTERRDFHAVIVV